MRFHAVSRMLAGAVATAVMTATPAYALDNRAPSPGGASTGTIAPTARATVTRDSGGLSESAVVSLAALGGVGLAGAAYGTRRRHTADAGSRQHAAHGS
jgi:hypothetical protein